MKKIDLTEKIYEAEEALTKNTASFKIFGDLNGDETPTMLAYRIAIGIMFNEYDSISKRLEDTLIEILEGECNAETTIDRMVRILEVHVRDMMKIRFGMHDVENVFSVFNDDTYITVPTLIDFVLNTEKLTSEETRIFNYAIATDIASLKENYGEGFATALLATNSPMAIIEMIGNAKKNEYGVRFDKCYDDEGNIYYEYADITEGDDPECPNIYYPLADDAEAFLRKHVWAVILKNAEEKYGVIA